MQKDSLQGPWPADAPEEPVHGVAATFKKAQQRMIIREREVVRELVESDCTIWTLEGFSRSGSND